MSKRRLLLTSITSIIFLIPLTVNANILDNVKGYSQNGHKITFDCGRAKVLIDMWSDDVARVWLSNDGSFNYYDTYKNYMIQPGLNKYTGPALLKVTESDTYYKIQTKDLAIRIQKSPFRLFFYKANNNTLITCNPSGQTLDTTIKVYFQRDATGVKEHFFGLLGGNTCIMDKRDLTITTTDINGDGFESGFYMSTAGYGLFFHNENTDSNTYEMGDPIIISNTAQKGQLDFFFIYGPDFRNILNRYTDITGKPPLPPKKLFGFNYLVQGTPVYYAGEFSNWRSHGYPVDNDITFTDYNIVANDDHVSTTVSQIHNLNGSVGVYYDINTPGTFKDNNTEDITYPYDNWTPFKSMIKTRVLDKGADWFWCDEDDWAGNNTSRSNQGFTFHLIQAITEVMESFDSRRGYVCSRGGSPGCQRFAYPWMGDLEFNSRTTTGILTNGLVGVAHATNDMCGAGRKIDSRGVVYNFLNPITQDNDWLGNPGANLLRYNPDSSTLIPWDYDSKTQAMFLKFDRLHYSLIPYWYTMAWQAYSKGLPDWRSLVIDYTDDANVYNNLDEMMIGDNLLFAPLYRGQNSRDIYLPSGKWYYYFDSNKSFNGNQTLTSFTVPFDEAALFVKGGAIIPMQPDMDFIGQKAIDPLILDIYPYSASSYTLYEDDGVTRNYINGTYCTSRYDCTASNDKIIFVVNTRIGSYNPGPRNYLLKVLQEIKPNSVTIDSKELTRNSSINDLNTASQGWGYFYDAGTKSNRVYIKFPDSNKAITVNVISNKSSAPLRK